MIDSFGLRQPAAGSDGGVCDWGAIGLSNSRLLDGKRQQAAAVKRDDRRTADDSETGKPIDFWIQSSVSYAALTQQLGSGISQMTSATNEKADDELTTDEVLCVSSS